MVRYGRTLFRYRDLLFTWMLREIRIRYKQTAIGALWAVLQPLSLMAVFTLVFSFLTTVPTDGVPYPVFAYTALLPWTFFYTSISFAVPSLVTNMNLVTKIYFPREIIPIASVGAALFDFFIGSIVFVAMMLLYGIPISWTAFWVLPLLIVQVCFTLGLVLFLSAVNVFFRDVRFVIPLMVQIWMYATPVIYPVTLVPERFRAVYMLNPMAGLIEGYRRVVLLGQSPVWSHTGVSAAIAALTFFGGYACFKKMEGSFADLI
jgi:lipopolysaccharide transport system permease protein